jgi:hypothetical protein
MMSSTAYIGPLESDDEPLEIRVESGTGDTVGMAEIGVYTHEDGDELALMYLTRDKVTDLHGALSAWLNG